MSKQVLNSKDWAQGLNKAKKSLNLSTRSTNVRPEDLLDDITLILDGKVPHYCTPGGQNISSWTGSYKVPLSRVDDISVRLPEHRYFFKAISSTSSTVKGRIQHHTQWEHVKGDLKVPVITSHKQLMAENGWPPLGANPVQVGTVVEFDIAYIGPTTKFRKPNDIQIKAGNYCYVSEIVLNPGSEVLSIARNDQGPLFLYQNHSLPPRYSSLRDTRYLLNSHEIGTATHSKGQSNPQIGTATHYVGNTTHSKGKPLYTGFKVFEAAARQTYYNNKKGNR